MKTLFEYIIAQTRVVNGSIFLDLTNVTNQIPDSTQCNPTNLLCWHGQKSNFSKKQWLNNVLTSSL